MNQFNNTGSRQYRQFIAKEKCRIALPINGKKYGAMIKIPRAYHADFEVYDERSKDWNQAEVDIFIS